MMKEGMKASKKNVQIQAKSSEKAGEEYHKTIAHHLKNAKLDSQSSKATTEQHKAEVHRHSEKVKAAAEAAVRDAMRDVDAAAKRSGVSHEEAVQAFEKAAKMQKSFELLNVVAPAKQNKSEKHGSRMTSAQQVRQKMLSDMKKRASHWKKKAASGVRRALVTKKQVSDIRATAKAAESAKDAEWGALGVAQMAGKHLRQGKRQAHALWNKYKQAHPVSAGSLPGRNHEEQKHSQKTHEHKQSKQKKKTTKGVEHSDGEDSDTEVNKHSDGEDSDTEVNKRPTKRSVQQTAEAAVHRALKKVEKAALASGEDASNAADKAKGAVVVAAAHLAAERLSSKNHKLRLALMQDVNGISSSGKSVTTKMMKEMKKRATKWEGRASTAHAGQGIKERPLTAAQIASADATAAAAAKAAEAEASAYALAGLGNKESDHGKRQADKIWAAFRKKHPMSSSAVDREAAHGHTQKMKIHVPKETHNGGGTEEGVVDPQAHPHLHHASDHGYPMMEPASHGGHETSIVPGDEASQTGASQTLNKVREVMRGTASEAEKVQEIKEAVAESGTLNEVRKVMHGSDSEDEKVDQIRKAVGAHVGGSGAPQNTAHNQAEHKGEAKGAKGKNGQKGSSTKSQTEYHHLGDEQHDSIRNEMMNAAKSSVRHAADKTSEVARQSGIDGSDADGMATEAVKEAADEHITDVDELKNLKNLE
jgi:hypothetical protein